MTVNVAVFGAAGSMGTRVTNAPNDDPDYWMLYMKAGDARQSGFGDGGHRGRPCRRLTR